MIWDTDQDTDLLFFYQNQIQQRKQVLDRLWPAPLAVPSGDPDVLLLTIGDGIHGAVNRSGAVKTIRLPEESLIIAISTGDRGDVEGRIVTLSGMTGCLLLGR